MRLKMTGLAMAGLALAGLAAGCAGGGDGGRGERGGQNGAATDTIQRPRVDALLLDWFDADRNGAITQAEISAGATAGFSAADDNGDRVLGAIELRTWGMAIGGIGAAAPLFAAVDGNGDASVTGEEFSRYFAARFVSLDLDNDGAVSRKELFEDLAAPPRSRPQVLQLP